MVHSIIKSLLLYSALAASVVLGTPAHHHLGRTADKPISISRFQPSARGKTPVPKRVTNGMRLANGLPPLAPRKLYHGSKAALAHKPRTSSTPPFSANSILVYDSEGLSGNLLGFLSENLADDWGYYFVTSDCNAAMTKPELLSGALLNPTEPQGYPIVGFYLQNPNNDVDFSTTSSNFAWMSGIEITLPLPPEDSHPLCETNIWSLGANNELIPTWINPDANAAHTELGYLPDYSGIMFITGSLSEWQNDWGISPYHIRLFLTDQPPCSVSIGTPPAR